MQTRAIEIDISKAHQFYRKYLSHRVHSTAIDDEARAIYRAIARGSKVIRALASIADQGVNAHGLPKLALARAVSSFCWARMYPDGSANLYSDKEWSSGINRHFQFKPGTFGGRPNLLAAKAIAPMIPIDLRPKRGLENYHLLWEADWTEVPVDPLLLRRFGKSDAWLVVAAWDLTEVERAVMSTRLRS